MPCCVLLLFNHPKIDLAFTGGSCQRSPENMTLMPPIGRSWRPWRAQGCLLHARRKWESNMSRIVHEAVLASSSMSHRMPCEPWRCGPALRRKCSSKNTSTLRLLLHRCWVFKACGTCGVHGMYGALHAHGMGCCACGAYDCVLLVHIMTGGAFAWHMWYMWHMVCVCGT